MMTIFMYLSLANSLVALKRAVCLLTSDCYFLLSSHRRVKYDDDDDEYDGGVTSALARLASETVQGATLTLQGVHDVHGGDGLPLGVLGVGDGVPDDVLEEHLQYTASLLVDQAGYALHSTAASETADGRLGDPLDVIAENLPVTLGSSFSQTFPSLSATGHLRFG